MSVHVHFIGVQIIALCVYIFLLCCFIGRVKDQSVKQLRNFLFASVVWVGGSFFMRLQLFPGLKFWFYLSLVGLVMMLGSIVDMTLLFLGCYRMRRSICYYVAASILLVIDILTESIIAAPEPVQIGNGIQYEYNIGIGAAFALIPLLLYFALFFSDIWRIWREKKGDLSQIKYLLIAVGFLLAGNIVVLFPGMSFPVDVASGIVAALFFVALFYQRHLFMLSERMMIGVMYTVSLLLAFMPILFLSTYLETIPAGATMTEIEQGFQSFAFIMGIWMAAVFLIASVFNGRYTNQREQEVQEMINGFQNQIKSSFDTSRICEILMETVMKLTQAEGVIVELAASADGVRQNFSVGTLQGKSQELSGTPEFLEFVLKCEECFFSRKSMKLDGFIYGNSMRKWLTEFGYSAIGCLENDTDLIGFIFIQGKQEYVITREREQQMSVVCYSAASALRNAILYRKMYEESITDELTGIYNRKYVLNYLNQRAEKKQDFGILYLDIDDFKLYNEIYGVEEGDRLLKSCAEMLQEVMPEGTKICRYAADEFVVFYREESQEEIYHLGMEVLQLLTEETEKSAKHIHYITMSGGVAGCQHPGQSAIETLHQAQQATSQAKGYGKNQIFIYNKEHFAEKGNEKNAYEDVKPTIYALTAAIDAKDSYTFMHIQKVSEYATALAREIGYSTENVEIIQQAALLHDIGKISIPERILQKKDRLTQEEYEIMKKHVVNSIDIIQFLPGMDYVIPAVIGHHERYDGKGYPRGIAGEEIPESARILAIADSFDAITAKRSYKEAQPITYAMEELERCKGTQFDPRLVDAFVGLIKRGVIELERDTN